MADKGTEELRQATEELTDNEFAIRLRGSVAALNTLVELAAERELIVNYRIKPIDNTPHSNPKLIVNVMTEVA